jgi:hypothetical protein
MAIDNQKTAALIACTPTVLASGRTGNIVARLIAALLSWWPRRDHPPNVPDNLRADLGLPPIYMMRSWGDVELNPSRGPAARRADHE